MVNMTSPEEKTVQVYFDINKGFLIDSGNLDAVLSHESLHIKYWPVSHHNNQ